MAHIAVFPAACRKVYSRYKENPAKVSASWEDCANLDELEVVERARVAYICKFFERSQHVPELAIIY